MSPDCSPRRSRRFARALEPDPREWSAAGIGAAAILVMRDASSLFPPGFAVRRRGRCHVGSGAVRRGGCESRDGQVAAESAGSTTARCGSGSAGKDPTQSKRGAKPVPVFAAGATPRVSTEYGWRTTTDIVGLGRCVGEGGLSCRVAGQEVTEFHQAEHTRGRAGGWALDDPYTGVSGQWQGAVTAQKPADG